MGFLPRIEFASFPHVEFPCVDLHVFSRATGTNAKAEEDERIASDPTSLGDLLRKWLKFTGFLA